MLLEDEKVTAGNVILQKELPCIESRWDTVRNDETICQLIGKLPEGYSKPSKEELAETCY